MAKIPKVTIEQMCRLTREGVLEVGDEFLVHGKDDSGETSTRREVVFQVIDYLSVAKTIHRSIDITTIGNPPTKIGDNFVVIDERAYSGYTNCYIRGKKTNEGDEEYHQLLKRSNDKKLPDSRS
jgi:hypothetical protein